MEVVIPDQFRQPLDLITFERYARFRRGLHMVLGPNGRVWVATEAGQLLSVLSLDLAAWSKDTLIRLSYSWDLKARKCWIGAENLDTGELLSAEGESTVPLFLEDLARILYATEGPNLADDVQCFAVADHVEPLGYSEGLAAGALVETEDGPCPIERLDPGILIVTSSGELTPLVATVTSHLPAIGNMAPLRLRRPFQNLRQTIDLTPRCEILTDGIDTAYFFGVEHVAIKARHIAPFLPAAQRHLGLMAKQHNLVLKDYQPFKVAGIAMLPLSRSHEPSMPAHTRLSHLSLHDVPRRENTAPDALLRHEAMALLSERYL